VMPARKMTSEYFLKFIRKKSSGHSKSKYIFFDAVLRRVVFTNQIALAARAS